METLRRHRLAMNCQNAFASSIIEDINRANVNIIGYRTYATTWKRVRGRTYVAVICDELLFHRGSTHNLGEARLLHARESIRICAIIFTRSTGLFSSLRSVANTRQNCKDTWKVKREKKGGGGGEKGTIQLLRDGDRRSRKNR